MAESTLPGRLIAPVVTKLRFGEAKNDLAYWQARSYQERLDALESIRTEYHLWRGDAESRLQRVYTIVKR